MAINQMSQTDVRAAINLTGLYPVLREAYTQLPLKKRKKATK